MLPPLVDALLPLRDLQDQQLAIDVVELLLVQIELANRIAGMKLASACAIIRKMFNTTGILSKDARISPLVTAGSIRGSLAIRLSSFLVLVDAETSAFPAGYVTNAARASALDIPDRIGAIPTGCDLRMC